MTQATSARRALSRMLGLLYGRAASAHHHWRYEDYRRRYDISPDFRFHGYGTTISGNGIFRAEAGGHIGAHSVIVVFDNTRVIFGHYCRIGRNCNIYTVTADADADAMTLLPSLELPSKSGDVIIGDGAWIGVNCFIGPGVTIGQDAVVGANSVVTESVDARTIVGGVPARLIRRKMSYSAPSMDTPLERPPHH